MFFKGKFDNEQMILIEVLEGIKRIRMLIEIYTDGVGAEPNKAFEAMLLSQLGYVKTRHAGEVDRAVCDRPLQQQASR